jgi:flagellar assembly protein FliH
VSGPAAAPEPPVAAEPKPSPVPAPPSPSPEELEAIRRRAHDEGYGAGLKKGLHQAEAQIGARVANLERVLGALAAPLDALDATVEQELVVLALTVAKRIVQREVRVDPTMVLEAVRAGLALLPVAQRALRLHVHPEDATVIREHMAGVAPDRPWQLIEDPTIARGGCRLEAEPAALDLTLERRIADVIDATLEGSP